MKNKPKYKLGDIVIIACKFFELAGKKDLGLVQARVIAAGLNYPDIYGHWSYTLEAVWDVPACTAVVKEEYILCGDSELVFPFNSPENTSLRVAKPSFLLIKICYEGKKIY